MAELLSIPYVAAEPSSLTPAQRKASILALIIDEFLRMGENEPVVIVLEDAHWIDATTLEMMMRLTDSIGRARALAVVTARPDFAPPWLDRPQATLLTLGRLSRQECTQLADSVAAAHGLSTQAVAAIVSKTDGIPLFVEELTRSVMESAGQDGAVPATLKDSLMARLDRLGEAREVAQIAAVIGRQFNLSLLGAVTSRKSDELETTLTKLTAAGIVFPEERSLERAFSFKHALVRDAAYESLLLARRREWHQRIATTLEKAFRRCRRARAGFAGASFRRGRPVGAGLRLSYARRRSGREPVGLSGGDGAFLRRPQAGAGGAIARGHAAATRFSAQARFGRGRHFRLEQRRGGGGIYPRRRDRRKIGG